MRIKDVAFLISFVLLGCGADSIFNSGAALVIWIVAVIIFGFTSVSIIKE